MSDIFKQEKSVKTSYHCVEHQPMLLKKLLLHYARFQVKYIYTFRDAILVPIICGTASIFAGLVIFSTVGFMAHIMQQDVSKVVAAGRLALHTLMPITVEYF